MRQLIPYRLWLGNALDARDLRRLYELEIVAVVDLALEEKPAVLGREILYCRFPLSDGGGNPSAVIRLAIETVELLVRSQVPALVACGAGMSHSPAIVAAALARVEDRPPLECLQQLVAGQAHDVSPLFWDQVQGAGLQGMGPSRST